MPTHVERIDSGIYQSHWIDNVTLEDVFDARDKIIDLAAVDGFSQYVVLIDGTRTKTVPMDLRVLTKTVDPASLAILVLNAPFAGEMMGRMFNKLMPMQVEFFRDRHTMMQRAEVLIKQVRA